MISKEDISRFTDTPVSNIQEALDLVSQYEISPVPPLSPNLSSSAPLPGNQRTDKYIVPYLSRGEALPIESIDILSYGLPGEDNLDNFSLPIYYSTPGVRVFSSTEYGSFEGAASKIRVKLNGLYSISSIEIGFGAPVILVAIEAGEDYSYEHMNLVRTASLALPNVQTDFIDVIVVVPSPNLWSGSYPLYIGEVVVRNQTTFSDDLNSIFVRAPGPIIGLTASVKFHQTPEKIREGGSTLNTHTGLPPRLFSISLPGFSSKWIPKGTYDVTVPGEAFPAHQSPFGVDNGTIWSKDYYIIHPDGKTKILRYDYEVFDNESMGNALSRRNEETSTPGLLETPASDISSYTTEVEFEDSGIVRLGYGNEESSENRTLILNTKSIPGPNDTHGLIRAGEYYTFNVDSEGSTVLGGPFNKNEALGWFGAKEEKYVDRLEIDLQRLDEETKALKIFSVTADGDLSYVGASRGGKSVLDVREISKGFILRALVEERPAFSKFVPGSSRKKITVGDDGWAVIKGATINTLVSVEHVGLTSNTSTDVKRQLIIDYASTSDWHSKAFGSESLLTRAIEPSYAIHRTEMRPWGLVRAASVTFKNEFGLDSDAILEISWNGEYHDSSMTDGREPPLQPKTQASDTVALYKDGSRYPHNELKFLNGEVDHIDYVYVRNPKILLDDGSYTLNYGSYENSSLYPGTTLDIGGSLPFVTLAEDSFYTLLVEEPSKEGPFGINARLFVPDPLYDTISFSLDPVTIKHFEFEDNSFTLSEGSLNGQSIKSVFEKSDVTVRCNSGDVFHVYSEKPVTFVYTPGRHESYKVLSISEFTGDSSSINLGGTVEVSVDGRTLIDNPFLYKSIPMRLGSLDARGVSLPAPILTQNQVQSFNLSSPEVGFPSPEFIRASWAKDNISLFVFDAVTLDLVEDEDVTINWSTGLIQSETVGELLVYWDKEGVLYDPVEVLTENVSVGSDLTIPTSRVILFGEGKLSVSRIDGGVSSILEDITDWKSGSPYGPRKPLTSNGFYVEAGNVIVSREGSYDITYSSSKDSLKVDVRGVSELDLSVNWYDPFSKEDLE